jgi:hypothetical protein
MPDRDVVLAKTAAIQRCLSRIRDVTGLVPDSIHDVNVQDVVVLNLQRAIQSAIDFPEYCNPRISDVPKKAIASTIKTGRAVLCGLLS